MDFGNRGQGAGNNLDETRRVRDRKGGQLIVYALLQTLLEYTGGKTPLLSFFIFHIIRVFGQSMLNFMWSLHGKVEQNFI